MAKGKVMIAVVGGRDFDDYPLLKRTIDSLIKTMTYGGVFDVQYVIVSGGAKGADSLAAQYARENNFDLIEYLPEWGKYGKRAGFVRNELIIKDADIVFAFWDGQSKGTKSSIDLAKKHNKILTVTRYGFPFDDCNH